MKILLKKTILFSIIILSIYNCKKDSNNNQSNNLGCRIKTISNGPIFHTFYDNNGLLEKVRFIEGDTVFKVYQYNSINKIIKINTFGNDLLDLKYYETFEYDGFGKLTKGYEFDKSNNLKGTYSFSYNNQNQLIKLNVSTSKINAYAEFIYLNNVIVSEIWKTSTGTIYTKYDFVWDNKINPFKQYNFPIRLFSTITETISEHNCIKLTEFNSYPPPNGQTNVTNYSYQYNTNGYPTLITGDENVLIEYNCN